jgi:hypothetical protein
LFRLFILGLTVIGEGGKLKQIKFIVLLGIKGGNLMSRKRQIKLSAYLVGTGMHVASWRHPDAQEGASIDIDYYKHLAQIAGERKV